MQAQKLINMEGESLKHTTAQPETFSIAWRIKKKRWELKMPSYVFRASWESSDEGEQQLHDSESDGGEVILGRNVRRPITVPEEEPEIDLTSLSLRNWMLWQRKMQPNANEEDGPPCSSWRRTNQPPAGCQPGLGPCPRVPLFKIFSSVISHWSFG